jgi:tryptophan 2,3-dioxygenase
MEDRKGTTIPEYGDSSITYGSYLQVPELLGLQRCLSDPPSHDELQFIVIHQSYELWFKLVLFELDSVMKLLAQRDLRHATWLMRRVTTIERALAQQIHILETMTPLDFLEFRHNLNPASGFQSVQFREIECLSNVKNPGILKHLRGDEESLSRLRRRLDQPTLWDAFLDAMKAEGFNIPDDRNSEQIKLEIARLHEEHAKHYDLFLFAESLIEHDELLGLWRVHHVRMVERMIGNKPGTGGSEGVRYLETTLAQKCFPDLWDARTYLKK